MLKLISDSTFLTGSAVYLISNILKSLIPFVLLPVLTRYLSPEQYGEVAMFQMLLGALAAVVGLSVHGAAVRKFYDVKDGSRQIQEFIGSCLHVLLVSSCVTFIFVFFLSGVLSEWLSLKISWILWAVIVTAWMVVIKLRLGLWQVRKAAKYYGALQVFHGLLDFALTLIFVVVLSTAADGRITAQIIAVGVFSLVALWLLRKDRLLAFCKWRADYVNEVLKFGVPLIPHVAGLFVLSSIDRLVINAELGLAQAGIYMVAVQISAAFAIVFDAVNKAYVPWLYEKLKNNRAEEKKRIVVATYIWYALILCIAGLSFLIGPFLVVTIAGESYSEAGDVIGWLVLGQVFGGMYLMVTNYIFYSKQTGLLSFVTLLSGLINIAFLLLLISGFGIEGAAYSFCIAMAARFILTWWVSQLRYPMPWFQFR